MSMNSVLFQKTEDEERFRSPASSFVKSALEFSEIQAYIYSRSSHSQREARHDGHCRRSDRAIVWTGSVAGTVESVLN